MTTECLVKNMSNGITAVKHYKLVVVFAVYKCKLNNLIFSSRPDLCLCR